MMKRILKFAAIVAVAAVPVLDLAQARGNGGGGGGNGGGGPSGSGSGSGSDGATTFVVPLSTSQVFLPQPERPRPSRPARGIPTNMMCANTSTHPSGAMDCGFR